MIKHSFPKLSLALFNRFKKKYKITPVPEKPSGGGFEQYLKTTPSFPIWKIKPSQVAMARKRAKRYG